jgi:hypothetical protein
VNSLGILAMMPARHTLHRAGVRSAVHCAQLYTLGYSWSKSASPEAYRRVELYESAVAFTSAATRRLNRAGSDVTFRRLTRLVDADATLSAEERKRTSLE